MAVEIPHFGSHNRAVWLGLIAIGVAAGLYFRHRQQSQAASVGDTTGDATPDMPNVDSSTGDPYSSGSYSVQGGIPGPPGATGARGPRGKRGKRGHRGKPGGTVKHKRRVVAHNAPAGNAQPAIATQNHLPNNVVPMTPVRVIQHSPTGEVRKGSRVQ